MTAVGGLWLAYDSCSMCRIQGLGCFCLLSIWSGATNDELKVFDAMTEGIQVDKAATMKLDVMLSLG